MERRGVVWIGLVGVESVIAALMSARALSMGVVGLAATGTLSVGTPMSATWASVVVAIATVIGLGIAGWTALAAFQAVRGNRRALRPAALATLGLRFGLDLAVVLPLAAMFSVGSFTASGGAALTITLGLMAAWTVIRAVVYVLALRSLRSPEAALQTTA